MQTVKGANMISNERFIFTGLNGCESFCKLLIFDWFGVKVVIVTALDDNSGTSVTNAAELLATAVCAKYELQVERMMWIEHYPKCFLRGETFDRVEFKSSGGRFANPAWSPLDWRFIRQIGLDCDIALAEPVNLAEVFEKKDEWAICEGCGLSCMVACYRERNGNGKPFCADCAEDQIRHRSNIRNGAE
jgi:hypothetical protein